MLTFDVEIANLKGLEFTGPAPKRAFAYRSVWNRLL
jgi:hypothetical protein